MINYISTPFRWFFKLEAASGLILLIAAIIALIISNSDFGEDYFNLLSTHILIGTKNFGLDLSILHWINDALMAIFFFVVTLEIKREFVHGELSKPKQALLPIIGAVGGMALPARPRRRRGGVDSKRPRRRQVVAEVPQGWQSSRHAGGPEDE